MFDLKQIKFIAEGLEKTGASLEKIAAVATKIDTLIEAAGGVEGLKEKLAMLNALAPTPTPPPPPPDQSA